MVYLVFSYLSDERLNGLTGLGTHADPIIDVHDLYAAALGLGSSIPCLLAARGTSPTDILPISLASQCGLSVSAWVVYTIAVVEWCRRACHV